VRWVVDGMNLIGSTPDGWWRDRPAARRRLVGVLSSFAAGDGAPEVTVVFDGRPTPGEVEDARAGGVDARFAPGGPDAADRAIEDLLGSLDDPGAVTVVTSDAALVAAVRRAGAAVEGVTAFRTRLASSG